MHIVTARVHHGYYIARLVRGGDGTRVGKAGLLLYGKGINLGAHQDRRTVSVAKNANHTSSSDRLVDVKSVAL